VPVVRKASVPSPKFCKKRLSFGSTEFLVPKGRNVYRMGAPYQLGAAEQRNLLAAAAHRAHAELKLFSDSPAINISSLRD